MDFKLNDYIDKYIQSADGAAEADKNVARHLKAIIPQTTHLDEDTFMEIVEELKKGFDNGHNFKNAFRKVCQEYILTGNIIEAELPGILTRIILDGTEFVEKITEERGIPSSRDDIRKIVCSKKRNDLAQLLKGMGLNIRKVVFATFDENDMDADPFIKLGLRDIVRLLALDASSFRNDQPLTAVCIRYENRDDVEKRFPVFPDAGWCDRFFPSAWDDNYGRTKCPNPKLKGMPEIVHENLKLSDVIEDIRFLEE